jgi:hypothetical protein
LRRTDEALAAFELAEQRFEEAGEGARGRPLAEWGKGRALSEAGRCDEALRTFDRYARLVRDRDPQSAALALEVAQGCTEVQSSR